MKNSIFVSIASYKDPLLQRTISDLFENAANPHLIRVVVFNQTDFTTTDDHLFYDDNKQVEVYSIDYRNTKGVSWARNIIQKLVYDEEYQLQIDAHMEFAKDWDIKLIEWLGKCNSTKPIFAFYPPGFDLTNGKQHGSIVKNEPRALNRKAVTSVGVGLSKQLCDLDNGDDLPIPSTTYAAGFNFSKIEYIKEVGYDPTLYWNYEETDQTLRAFTHGWDFFSTPEPIIWHKYNTAESSPSHFKEAKDGHGLENRSNDHAEKKYFSNNYNGPYALGSNRTLKEFEILNNIDFEKGELRKKESKDMIIVVPYRDREHHLKEYLEKVPKYFDTQDITYDILITELDPQGDWNAGLVCNSVINFIKRANYKYIYIHHVDVYPVQGKWHFPQDGEIYTNIGDAGSCLTTLHNFLKVGGYRNNFWGWGAEDDDLYKTMFNYGIRVLNVEQEETPFKVDYDTKFQNHNRSFEAKNYGGNIEELNKTRERNINSIFDTNKYGVTHSLEKIGNNIYKQKVRPLRISPKDTSKKNLLLGLIYNLEPKDILPFVKTATIFGAQNFDTTLIDISENIHPEVEKELRAYKINLVKMPPTGDKSEFTERYKYFREYLNSVDYENVIMTDVLDVFLQGNPFEHYNDIPVDHVVFGSEGITIGDSDWNRGTLRHIYSQSILDTISPYEVLCCGVIGGRVPAILDLIDKYLEEHNKVGQHLGRTVRGEDQPIIQKLLYYDQTIKRHVFRHDTPYTIHLHPIIHQPDKCRFTRGVFIQTNAVRTKNNELYSIVHQYNRSEKLYDTIINHYSQGFATIVKN